MYVVQKFVLNTFKKGTQSPGSDGTQTRELTIRHFQEEQRNSTQEEESDIGDQKGTWKTI